jgi:transposase-like protein
MGRPKGGTNRYWSKDEKLRIVKRYLEEGISSRKLSVEENVDDSMIRRWVRKYLSEGESALDQSSKKGNRFSALWVSKSLTETERLQLIVQKQEIEIERLKKGYLVKGVGADKEFVITKDVSLKS